MNAKSMLDLLILKFGPVETARKLGVSYTTIFRWERGDYPIPSGASVAVKMVWERECPNG